MIVHSAGGVIFGMPGLFLSYMINPVILLKKLFLILLKLSVIVLGLLINLFCFVLIKIDNKSLLTLSIGDPIFIEIVSSVPAFALIRSISSWLIQYAYCVSDDLIISWVCFILSANPSTQTIWFNSMNPSYKDC